jgi:hypothetical protein
MRNSWSSRVKMSLVTVARLGKAVDTSERVVSPHQCCNESEGADKGQGSVQFFQSRQDWSVT